MTFNFEVKVRLNWSESFTVACNCSVLVKDSDSIGIFIVFVLFSLSLFLFFFRPFFKQQRLLHYGAEYYKTSYNKSTWSLKQTPFFRFLIKITNLDLEPNPDFRFLVHISKPTGWSFLCDGSNWRSDQVLHFVQLHQRAPTYIWGRYDRKTDFFSFFSLYLFHITPDKKLLSITI